MRAGGHWGNLVAVELQFRLPAFRQIVLACFLTTKGSIQATFTLEIQSITLGCAYCKGGSWRVVNRQCVRMMRFWWMPWDIYCWKLSGMVRWNRMIGFYERFRVRAYNCTVWDSTDNTGLESEVPHDFWSKSSSPFCHTEELIKSLKKPCTDKNDTQS